MFTLKNCVKAIATMLALMICVHFVEGKGAIFLSKEESHQVLKGGHKALSELDEWETYYEDIYTHKMRFGTGAGLSRQMETLVERRIISPRVKEQMLDRFASRTLGANGVSPPEESGSLSPKNPEENVVILGLQHISSTTNPLH